VGDWPEEVLSYGHGAGAYLWYLTTILPFYVAGYAGTARTRATEGMAIGAIVLGAFLYGACVASIVFATGPHALRQAVILGVRALSLGSFPEAWAPSAEPVRSAARRPDARPRR
jgi:hypothetical protein